MMENNTEMKSYAGFTIGPIYGVLSSARKTRELWFASYFFSWFMEKSIEQLSKNNKIDFLSPFVKEPFEPNNSITGKYHDRFILQSYLDKGALFREIQEASNNTLDFFVGLIDNLVKQLRAKYINGANKNTVKDILNSYIQRNFVVFDANDFESSKESRSSKKQKIVKYINKYLDSMEENRFFDIGILNKTCFICRALPANTKANVWVKPGGTKGETESKSRLIEKELCPLCFIKYYAHRSNEAKAKISKNNLRYPTILDIAAVELLTEEVKKQNPIFKDYEKDYEFEDIEQAVRKTDSKEEADSLLKKSYSKYFAIIQVDGDSLGKVFDKLTNFDELESFSKSLFNFANEAEKIITFYKGYPIYIGGDDILAFTPVAFKGDDGKAKTVIDLAIELSDAYRDIVGKNHSETTLSIGVNIAYYKFPLSLSLKNARKQLFEEAKKDDKNALALLLTKHSGHQIGFKFKFGSNDIKNFSELLRKTLAGDVDFPHSLHYNLSRFKTVIANIPDKDRLKAFFENNFNEPEHSKYTSDINSVMNYFKEVMFHVPREHRKKRLDCVKEILNKLAFIKFLRGEK